MRTRTLLRSGPALRTALVLLPALVWFGLRNTNGVIAYGESVTAQSTIVLGFVSAACGACAAWEAARVRRAGVAQWAPVRGGLRIALLHLTPVAVLGLLGVLVSLAAFTTAAADPPGPPAPAVLLTGCAVVLSHIALGWLVGGRLPPVLGTAAMLVFGYIWGFWPAALGELPWLRHLNAQSLGDCCGLEQTASVRSMAAAVLFSAGLIGAALIAVAVPAGRPRRRLAVAAVPVVAAAGALVLAVPLGFTSVQARDPELRRCHGERVRVCLWPEQEDHRSELLAWAEDAGRRITAVGVAPPSEVEFGEPRPREGTVRATTAAGTLPTAPPACALTTGAAYPGEHALTAIHVWLALTAGESRANLVLRWPAEAVTLAERVRELPSGRQQAWYRRNMLSVRDCSVAPRLDPAAFAGTAFTPTSFTAATFTPTFTPTGLTRTASARARFMKPAGTAAADASAPGASAVGASPTDATARVVGAAVVSPAGGDTVAAPGAGAGGGVR
jgi:hypothetical protein